MDPELVTLELPLGVTNTDLSYINDYFQDPRDIVVTLFRPWVYLIDIVLQDACPFKGKFPWCI